MPAKYDPIKYWTDENTDYLSPGQSVESIPAHIEHVKAFNSLLHPVRENIRTVFEIGCGYGRMTKHFLDNNVFPNLRWYHAIDLSGNKIRKAMEYLHDYIMLPESEIKLLVWMDNFAGAKMRGSDTMETIKQHYGGYDLVFSCQVLMHQLPDDIDYWVKKTGILSKKYIINLDWFQDPEPKDAANWNFVHNYETIYMRQLGVFPEHIQKKAVGDLRQNIYMVTKPG
jgi:hypothetical protein